MGLFDGLFGKKKKKSSALGFMTNPIGSLTGGIGSSGINDVLFGKKSKDVKGRFERQDPRIAELLNLSQPYRKEAIGAFGSEISRLKGLDTNKMAGEQTQKNLALTERGLLGSLEDQKRKMAELSAQRGLGGSSIGIGAILGAQRSTADQLARQKADIRTNESNLANQLASQRMAGLNQAQSGISGAISGMPMRNYIQGAKGVRGGGLVDVLAPIGGAAIGGYFGGPQGASVGMQAGRGIGSILGGMA